MGRLARDLLVRRFCYLRGGLWALLEDWWPAILEAAGLAGWQGPADQGSAGQKVLLPKGPAVDPTRRLVAWSPRGCRLGWAAGQSINRVTGVAVGPKT